MEPSLLSASQVAQEKDLLLLDIRPPEERWGEQGFIPASLSAPMSPPWAELSVPKDALSFARGVVLVCLSGHRAKLAWREEVEGRPVFVLDGGTLRWAAAGLPLANVPRAKEQAEPASSRKELYQMLRSCFIAEWIESTLNQGSDPSADPVQLLDACFSSEGVDPLGFGFTEMRRVLDRLALLSLQAGTERSRIANNLTTMLQVLQKSALAA